MQSNNPIENTTINEYLKLLKSGENQKLCKEINEWLVSKINSVNGNIDLSLFLLQKDVLIIQCKYWIAVFELNEENKAKYFARYNQLKAEFDRKNEKNKGKEKDAYTSMLDWLLALKKYFGSDIDRNSDLVELVAATSIMMKDFDRQTKLIESQNNNTK